MLTPQRAPAENANHDLCRFFDWLRNGDGDMLTRDEIRNLGLEAKDRLKLTWRAIGESIGRSPVYAAMLVYGYGQATAEEAAGLIKVLSFPAEVRAELMKAPHRTPAQPWP